MVRWEKKILARIQVKSFVAAVLQVSQKANVGRHLILHCPRGKNSRMVFVKESSESPESPEMVRDHLGNPGCPTKIL
jgi:hypothetical protein